MATTMVSGDAGGTSFGFSRDENIQAYDFKGAAEIRPRTLSREWTRDWQNDRPGILPDRLMIRISKFGVCVDAIDQELAVQKWADQKGKNLWQSLKASKRLVPGCVNSPLRPEAVG